ncbi:protein tyrosine phosphatase type IVA 2 isoform 2-T4 [Amazona ochrocephala]
MEPPSRMGKACSNSGATKGAGTQHGEPRQRVAKPPQRFLCEHRHNRSTPAALRMGAPSALNRVWWTVPCVECGCEAGRANQQRAGPYHGARAGRERPVREEPCGGARALGCLRAGPGPAQPKPRRSPSSSVPSAPYQLPARCLGGAGPARKKADALNAQGTQHSIAHSCTRMSFLQQS